jgi:hypothetical protein
MLLFGAVAEVKLQVEREDSSLPSGRGVKAMIPLRRRPF